MSVGLPVGKADIDQKLGVLALQLRDLIMSVPQLKARLDAMADTDLTSLGYTTAEVALIRSCMVDLDQIQQVALGLATQPTAYDFRTNTSKLMGIN
jgi:hypothetical protein